MCGNNDECVEDFVEDDGCISYEDLQGADEEFVSDFDQRSDK